MMYVTVTCRHGNDPTPTLLHNLVSPTDLSYMYDLQGHAEVTMHTDLCVTEFRMIVSARIPGQLDVWMT